MCTKVLKIVVCLVALTWGYPHNRANAQDISAEDTYKNLIDSSFVFGNQGRFDLAESYLRRAIAERPKHPLNAYLLNNLGGIQQLQGHTEAALLSYTAALELNHEEQTTRLNRARLYASMDNHKAAITDYSILIAQAPKNELYKYQRAMLYILDGEYNLADIDLSAIIQENDKSLKARIGYALLETKRGNYIEAERLYDYLLTKLPKSAEVYEGRSRLYLLQNKQGFALRDINRAIELAGSKPTASLYRLKAEIATAMGDKSAAESAQKRAEALKRSNI